MTPNDFERFSEILVGFAALKGRELPKPAIKLFWRAMQHWDLADFDAAAHQLLRSCAFMPTPKDFEDLRKQASRECVSEIWPQVQRWIRGFGGPPEDAVAVRTVRAMGGVETLGRRSTDEAHWTAKEFAERYAELRDVAEAREAVPQLAGPLAHRQLTGGRPKSAAQLVANITREGI